METKCQCCCAHTHTSPQSKEKEQSIIRKIGAPVLSGIFLITGIIFQHQEWVGFSHPVVEFCWFLLGFLPVGLPVMREAWEGILRKDWFNEFSLMALASLGAFYIGEYPEALAVMLLYTLGEMLQDKAVNQATRNIRGLLDVRPERVDVYRENTLRTVSPRDVNVGETIEVKPGERVPLDGTLQNPQAVFDTSALTGESMPRNVSAGGDVLAGMIVSGQAVRILVTKPYDHSTLARILNLVQDAAERKAPAELFIRRFARIYTPIVVLLAVLIVALPALVAAVHPGFDYVFNDWLYRGLVFLVISCPCALIISIPLGYFGGIGAASRMGILFKGSNYLDAITRVNAIVFDKTGTLTTGSFRVTSMQAAGLTEDELLRLVLSVEKKSTHPVAQAVARFAAKRGVEPLEVTTLNELAGYGLEAEVGPRKVLVGNIRLLKDEAPETLDWLQKLFGKVKQVKEGVTIRRNETTSSDISGLIGQYAHGNEPSHHVIHMYNYVNRPWRTQELVDSVYRSQYANAVDGLSGNEDCGQMSAWYVLNSMGFYQVCPGKPVYSIGRPAFDKAVVNLPDGKKFTVIAKNNSKKNKYIKSMTLNGKPLDKPFFTHDDIIAGSTLEIEMTDRRTQP